MAKESYLALAAGALLGVLAACTTIPKADLNAYRESFDKARSASEDVLDVHARTVEQHAKLIADRPQQENSPDRRFPVEFKPAEAVSATPQNLDIVARRQALAAIGRYNDVLATLAEGRSVEEVQASFASFQGSMRIFLAAIGASHPYASAVAPLVNTLFTAIEQARTREEFRKALEQGEPVIIRMIDEVFIADTKDFYKIRSNLARRHVRLVRRKGLDQAKLVMTIAAERREPRTASLRAAKSQTQQRLSNALKRLDHAGKSATIAGESRTLGDLSGRARSELAYDELVQVRADGIVDSVESSADAYDAIVDAMNAYHRLLTEYVRLLNHTKATLLHARGRLHSPPDMEAMARQLSLTAVKVKQDVDNLRAALEGVN